MKQPSKEEEETKGSRRTRMRARKAEFERQRRNEELLHITGLFGDSLDTLLADKDDEVDEAVEKRQRARMRSAAARIDALAPLLSRMGLNDKSVKTALTKKTYLSQ